MKRIKPAKLITAMVILVARDRPVSNKEEPIEGVDIAIEDNW